MPPIDGCPLEKCLAKNSRQFSQDVGGYFYKLFYLPWFQGKAEFKNESRFFLYLYMYVQRTTAYKKYRYKQKNYILIFFHKRILLSPFLAIQEELKEAPSHTVDNKSTSERGNRLPFW